MAGGTGRQPVVSEGPSLISGRMTGWQRRGLAAVLAGVIAFYFWTVQGDEPIEFSGQKNDYYNLLTHSFLEGHLYLDVPIAPALLKLVDPYDPAQHRGLGMHDASYYQGHYYLYWGVTPAVLLFLPYHLLTGGADFPGSLASPVFCSVGIIAVAALLVDIRRRFFPRAGFWVLLGGLLAAALGSQTLATMRRPGFWETPIAAGYGCAMMALWCAYQAMHRERPARWLMLAGLCYGLAVGARPVYAPAGIALALPLLALAWRYRMDGRWRVWPHKNWWLQLGAFLIPVALCAAGLALYNYERFGNPLEFGQRYQLAGVDQTKAKQFSLDYVPFNWNVYFLEPAHWSRYFPFVKFASGPQAPPGYYGTEFVYGALSNLPAIWLALPALVLALKIPRKMLPGYVAFVGTTAIFAICTAGVLLLFYAATARYMADFLPGFILLGAVGGLGCDHYLVIVPRSIRAAGRLLLAGVLAFTMFFGLMASFQLHDLLRLQQPTVYASLERIFNQPVYWAEQLGGTQHGPLRISLRLPTDKAGKIEPLVVTGWAYEADFVFFYYVDSQHLQIGFDHTNHGPAFSRVLPVDYDKEHTVVVDMGSLYPPSTHPMFAGMWPVQVYAYRRHYRISFDGVVVMESVSAFYDSSPGHIAVGFNPVSDAFGRKFTGQIQEVQRLPPHPSLPADDLIRRHGPLKLWVNFPTALGVTPYCDPLVVSGQPQKGNTLYVEYLGGNRIRFGYDHWGFAAHESEVIDVEFSQPHLLEIDFGALHPSDDAPGKIKQAPLIVRIDGRDVWRTQVPYFVCRPGSLIIGSNAIGSTVCRPEFSGSLFVSPPSSPTVMRPP